MRNVLFLGLLVMSSFSFAGRVVKHQHRCPAVFVDMNVCLNYEMPDEINLSSEDETTFVLDLYSWDSAYSGKGERELVDVEGELSAELMMSHSDGSHMAMPLTLEKIGVGKYLVHKAHFVMSGTWGIGLTLKRPDQPALKRAELFLYIYPDSK